MIRGGTLHGRRRTLHAFLRAPSNLISRPLTAALTIGILLSVLAGTMPDPAPAQAIYKYTDKNGAVVLTDNPPKGVKARPFIAGEHTPKLPPADKEGSVVQAPPPGSMKIEEALRQKDQTLDQLMKTVETRDRDREIEKQRRLREAERLEDEARQPIPSTRENRQRQYELLKEAEKLRRMD